MIKTFHSIEGLRGWLAWWVVIGHSFIIAGTPEWLPGQISNLIRRGDVAVNAFIIVSGFVVTHLLMKKDEAYIPYIIRRVFRLWPVYLACITFALTTTDAYRFTFIQLPFAEDIAMRSERLATTDTNLTTHLALHATLLHGLIPESMLKFSSSSILSPAWSLSLEWQFYLLAPLIIPLLFRRLHYIAMALLASALIAYLTKSGLGNQYQYPSALFLSIHFFAIGIASRLLLDRVNSLNWKQFAALVFLGVVFFAFYKLEAIIWLIWSIFVLYEQGSLQIGKKADEILNKITRLITLNTIISTIGKYSYSTYLIHIPIFTVFVYVGLNYLDIPQERTSIHALLAASYVGTFVASHLLYTYIEKPGIKIGTQVSAALNHKNIRQ